MIEPVQLNGEIASAVDGPGPISIAIRGRARVDLSMNDAVYETMIQGERDRDSQRAGVAVVIAVDAVSGVGSTGSFQMERHL